MEQRLDATYLRASFFERTAAIGVCGAALGTGIFLAAYGISLLSHYKPPEIAMRIANPEIHITQDRPLKVAQDKPFVVAQPESSKSDPAKAIIDESSRSVIDGVQIETKTDTGDLIKREVTVFSNVKHAAGTVFTGWNYRDGRGGAPSRQFCYYTASNMDRSSIKVDIALDGVRLPNIAVALVPDLEGALARCQWWKNEDARAG